MIGPKGSRRGLFRPFSQVLDALPEQTMRPRRSFLILALFPLPSIISAQQPPPVSASNRPVVKAVRTSESLQIDGRLEEATWALAPATSGFTQVDPEEGERVGGVKKANHMA